MSVKIIIGCLAFALLFIAELPAAIVHGQEAPLPVCLNVFVIGGTPAFIAQRPTFTTAEALLGEPSAQAQALIRLAFDGVNSVWSQCQLGFSLNLVAVVAADRIVLPSTGATLLQGRRQIGVYRDALRILANEALPPQHRVYRCLNLFLVDALPPGILGIAELPFFGQGLIGLVQWRAARPLPVLATAHELGHNLGLEHVDSRVNLMFPTLAGGMVLTPQQCRTAQSRAQALNSSLPPRILDVLFPQEMQVGKTHTGLIIFLDSSLDLALVGIGQTRWLGDELALLPGRLLAPKKKGIASGFIPVSVRCSATGPLLIQFTLIDELGRTANATVRIECRA